MSVTIPLGGGSAPAAGAASGVKIPLGLSLPALGGVGVSRETQILRAVAASAALQDPEEALRLAKRARDDPASVIDPTIDEAALGLVLAAVARRLTDKAGAPTPNALHEAAARAVGAHPALVAAADAVLSVATHGALDDAFGWVASIEPALLDTAARAGARRRQLDRAALVPVVPPGRLDTLEARLVAVEGRLPPAAGGSTAGGATGGGATGGEVSPAPPAGSAREAKGR